MSNSHNGQNRKTINNDKILIVFSHLFFISLIILCIFTISTLVNTMTPTAYKAESPSVKKKQGSSVKKSEDSVYNTVNIKKSAVLSGASAVAYPLSAAKKRIQAIEEKSGNEETVINKITRISGKDLGFYVTGIISGKEGNRAVITGENGKSYMIQTGEKIGKWFVDSIDKEQVVLKTDGYIALIEPSPGLRSLKMPRKDTFEGVMGIDDEDPGFRLTGIIKGREGINAILTGLDGINYTVKPGEVLGTWTVSFITDKTVFLKNNKTTAIAVLELATPSQEMEEMKNQEYYQDVMVL